MTTHLQAHCQSHSSQRIDQSFVKEPASRPNEEKKFLKMPHYSGEKKMKDRKSAIRTDRKTKHETLTGGCCQWRGSASYDNAVHIETVVLRRKFSSEFATEQQPPNRWA